MKLTSPWYVSPVINSTSTRSPSARLLIFFSATCPTANIGSISISVTQTCPVARKSPISTCCISTTPAKGARISVLVSASSARFVRDLFASSFALACDTLILDCNPRFLRSTMPLYSSCMLFREALASSKSLCRVSTAILQSRSPCLTCVPLRPGSASTTPATSDLT